MAVHKAHAQVLVDAKLSSMQCGILTFNSEGITRLWLAAIP